MSEWDEMASSPGVSWNAAARQGVISLLQRDFDDLEELISEEWLACLSGGSTAK